LLLAAGVIVRLILVAITPGEFYDTTAIAHVGKAFLTAPLHVYDLDVNPGSYQGSPTYPWPYLPGFLPVAGLLRWLSDHLGASVNRLDRTVIVGADVAVAWVVQWALGRLGRSERERLQGVALVAFGPAFIAVSGVHGQIDALAWFPAVAAVALWELRRDGQRALACGALIGLGIAIKTTPGLVLLALAPTARDRRELAHLVASAAVVPALMVVPFALAAPKGLQAIIHYRGFAGRAGLTVLLQPRLAVHELTGPAVTYDATTTFLLDHTGLILAIALVPVVISIWRWRVPAASATVALLLAVYVAGPAILPQYWLWIVPFMILAGYRGAALAYQLALLPLLVATYAFLQEPDQPFRHLSTGLVLYGYVPLLWIVTAGLLGGLVALLVAQRRLAQRRLREQPARRC
jgi:hypothetical protein